MDKNEKLKFKIHYDIPNGRESFIVTGGNIHETTEKAYKEFKKRGIEIPEKVNAKSERVDG